MSQPYDETNVEISRDSVENSMLDRLEEFGFQPRTLWGNVLRVVIRVCAWAFADFTKMTAQITRMLILDLSTGPWLTDLAYYFFGVTRVRATAATGEVTLTNNGGGSYTGTNYAAGTVLFVNPDTGKTYKNAEQISLVGQGSTQTLAISAVDPGAASSSPAGTITQFVTPLTGVSVTNAQAIIGTDAWTDETTRAACRGKLASLSPRGTENAYDYAILVAKRLDGSPVNISRKQISESSSTGEVTILLASPSGAPIQDDLDAVSLSIENLVRPDAIRFYVKPVVEKPFTKDITVWARRTPGVDAAGLRTLVLTALLPEIQAYPIGGLKLGTNQGRLVTDGFRTAIMNAHPSIVNVENLGKEAFMAANEVVVNAIAPSQITVRFEGT